MLRKTIFLLGLTAIMAARSQDKKTAVETNPLLLLSGAVNLGLEKAVSEKQSFQVAPFFIYSNTGGSKESGFGFSADYRFYSKTALDGFYFGPVTTYGSFNSENGFSDDSATLFLLGAKIGWNWLLGKNDNFVIDLGLGAAHYTVKTDGFFNLGQYGAYPDEDFVGVGPVLNFSIGHAF